MPSTSAPLDAVIELARPIVERIVWCAVSTTDGSAPRSRLMHPVWSWPEGGPVALVSARPTPLKVAHLAERPAVSCFYWDPAHDTVAIDADAQWLPPEEVGAAWDAVAAVDPPVGFDPSMIWPEGPGAPDCGFLRFTAHRIVVTAAGGPSLRWSRPGVSGEA